ncbi:MAG: Gldg family protein [Clostridia bacterium]|nr:Gldg family protein [Clostridia bacterium]
MGNFLQKLKRYTGRTNFSRSIVTICVILVAIVFNAVVYSLTTIFGLYLYQPTELDFSLSASTDAIMASIEEEGGVEVLFCMPREELKTHATGSYLLKTVEQMEEKYSDAVTFRFINIITKMDEEGKFFDMTPFTKDENGNDVTIFKTSVIFRSDKAHRVLTSNSYEDFYFLNEKSEPLAYCGEEVFLSLMLWVQKDYHPTAYFTAAHSEIPDAALARVLAAAGYKIGSVNLRREDIPDDCDLLVINSPVSDFERGSGVTSEMDRLYEYADAGGALYVSLDPFLKTPLPVLEGFLKEYGIALSRSEIAGETFSNIVTDNAQGITADGYTLVGRFDTEGVGGDIHNTVLPYSDGNVLLYRCGALSLSDGASPLLYSSASSEIYASGERVGKDGNYVLCAKGTREGENGTSSVFVMPSVYFTASDAMLSNTYSNREFLLAVFGEIFENEGMMPYGVRSVKTETNLIEDLSLREARLYTVIAFLPAVALVALGAVVLIRRKYK